MTTLSSRIIKYILKRDTTTLNDLEGVVVRHGFTVDDLYAALEQVHRDKRITQTATKDGVTYRKTIARQAEPTPHLTWLREHYPAMTKENDGSGFDIDLSWMFLKTKEERDAYKAAASGKPLHMVKSRHDRANKR